jgi:predicted nucleic acid-binding protein
VGARSTTARRGAPGEALTRFLLDTSIVSAAMWKIPDTGVLEKLDEHGGECAISAHVWHELRYGVARLPRGKRRDLLEAFLRDVVYPTLPILVYDERAAEWLAKSACDSRKLVSTQPSWTARSQPSQRPTGSRSLPPTPRTSRSSKASVFKTGCPAVAELHAPSQCAACVTGVRRSENQEQRPRHA